MVSTNRGRARAQRGHILLMAIVMVTLVSVMLAMAMQPSATASTRMRERELVYRGEHIAAGIRGYYQKFGRFPYNLDELTEADPPLIRKLYKDPMTGEADWILVYLEASNRMQLRRLAGQLGRIAETLDENTELNSETVTQSQEEGGFSGNLDKLFDLDRRQITGIRSSSDVEGLKLYQDSRIYKDWLFSALPEKQTEQLTGGNTGVLKPPGAQQEVTKP